MKSNVIGLVALVALTLNLSSAFAREPGEHFLDSRDRQRAAPNLEASGKFAEEEECIAERCKECEKLHAEEALDEECPEHS